MVSLKSFRSSGLFSMERSGLGKVWDVDLQLCRTSKIDHTPNPAGRYSISNLSRCLRPTKVSLCSARGVASMSPTERACEAQKPSYEAFDEMVGKEAEADPEESTITSQEPLKDDSKPSVQPSPSSMNRLQLRIPTCDSVAVRERQGSVVAFTGGAASISCVRLDINRTQPIDAKGTQLVDPVTGSVYKRMKLQVNAIRYLPLRDVLLVGADSGHIHTVV